MQKVLYLVLYLLSPVPIRRVFANPISSIGNIGFLNNCEIAVYFEITRETNSAIKVLEPGETYREKYHFPAQGGTSMKIAKDTNSLQSGDNEVQLEYTCTDQCYVDFSLINDANRFPRSNATLTLRPSDPKCDTLICVAGDSTCRDAYYKPIDNQAVRACSLEASWTLTLCARPSNYWARASYGLQSANG